MIFVYRTSPVVSKKALSDYAEGDIIKLNENGSPVEFYVAKHDYESGLNGAGRTLVVRVKCVPEIYYSEHDENAYATSDMDNYFNTTYANMLDASVLSASSTTKFYYTPGGTARVEGDYNLSTLERKIFTLSATEYGFSSSYIPNSEGTKIPISDTLRTIYVDNYADRIDTYTRTPSNTDTYWNDRVIIVRREGDVGTANTGASQRGCRPCFTLPSTLLFNPDTNEVVA